MTTRAGARASAIVMPWRSETARDADRLGGALDGEQKPANHIADDAEAAQEAQEHEHDAHDVTSLPEPGRDAARRCRR